MKNVLRTFLSLWYLLGWMSHVYLAFANPGIYRDFGETALLPGLRGLWQKLIFPNIVLFALALGQTLGRPCDAAGQMAVLEATLRALETIQTPGEIVTFHMNGPSRRKK